MEIAERIKSLMSSRGLTRYKLAKVTGVPYTTLIKILDGTTKSPQIETISAIADYLGVTVDYLSGQSAGAIIEVEMKMADMSVEELAAKAKVRKEFLMNIDSIDPDSGDYEAIERVAKVLKLNPAPLRSALARQEPPGYEGPADERSIEEIFADEDFSEVETIAAHHEGEDWTDEELEEIERFKEFVRSKRKRG